MSADCIDWTSQNHYPCSLSILNYRNTYFTKIKRPLLTFRHHKLKYIKHTHTHLNVWYDEEDEEYVHQVASSTNLLVSTMADLQVTQEVVVCLHSFHNVDLFQRGWVIILTFSYIREIIGLGTRLVEPISWWKINRGNLFCSSRHLRILQVISWQLRCGKYICLLHWS